MLFGSSLFITSSLASSSRAGATIGMELESKNGILHFSPIRLSMRRGGHGTGGDQSSSPSHRSRGHHAMRAPFKSALIGPYLAIPGCTFAESEKMPHSGHTMLLENLFLREFFILLLIFTPQLFSQCRCLVMILECGGNSSSSSRAHEHSTPQALTRTHSRHINR
jgi:hypothetical protein